MSRLTFLALTRTDVEISPDHIMVAGLRFVHVHSRVGLTPSTNSTEPLLASTHVLDFPSSPASAEFNIDPALDFYPTPFGQHDKHETDCPFGSGTVPIKRAVIKASLRGGERRDVFSRNVDYSFKAFVHDSIRPDYVSSINSKDNSTDHFKFVSSIS